MELVKARKLAVNLMAKHGLDEKGWIFDFDNATSRLGVTKYNLHLITLSRYMTLAADEETVRQVILHEVAHALLPYYGANGKKTGHGAAWKAKAAEIGYTGKRTAENPYKAPARRPSSRTPRRRYASPQVLTVVPTALLSKGAAGIVVNNAPKKYAGQQVKVLNLGAKRYRVEFVNSGIEMYVPFSMLLPA